MRYAEHQIARGIKPCNDGRGSGVTLMTEINACYLAETIYAWVKTRLCSVVRTVVVKCTCQLQIFGVI